MKRYLVLIGVAAAAVVVFAACSGGGNPDPNGGGAAACAQDLDKLVLRPVDADYIPIIASSDLAVGENRFVVGLIRNEDGEPVKGAELHLRLFCFTQDGEQVDKLETDATSLTITRSITHTHDDGTVETHEAGELGVYVAQVSFDQAAKWGLEVTGTLDGKPITAQSVTFDVRAEPLSPAIGEPAPRSVQLTLKDVADIRQIDTSANPIPEMHDKTIAEAVTSGKPTVIAFATPAFCTSQMCGPAKEIVDQMYEKYKEQANFVHVEPYRIEEARSGKGLCPVPIMNVQYAANPPEGCPAVPPEQLPPPEQSWGLSTEPWVFVVDRDGKIAAKFETAFSEQELEDALKAVLAP